MNKGNFSKLEDNSNDAGQMFIDMKDHYEIEYINFIINILEPFIDFKFNKGDDVIKIFYKDSKLPGGKKEISVKEFIHFIQISFPRFIKEEANDLRKVINKEHQDKDTFERFLKLGIDEFKDSYVKQKKEKDDMYDTVINMNTDEIEKRKTFYNDDKGYNELSKVMRSKLTYLDRLLHFNKEKHSKIDDILKLVENIKYLL